MNNLAVGVGLLMTLAAISAFASWEEHFLQITCSPDAEYFSVKSFALQDTNELSDDKASATGIYSLRQLVKKPVNCQLKHHMISIEVLTHHEASAKGMCGGEAATFVVKYDGAEVSKVSSGGGCGQRYQSEVTLSPSNKRNCTVRFNPKWNEGIETESPSVSCTTIELTWFEKQKNLKAQEK